MSEATPRKRRRVARYVSDVDRHLIADAPDRGDGANDARLLENVPPHSQARA